MLAAFPDNPGFSKHIFASYPNIKVEDMADLVDYLLETSEHVQMQDLKVTHVHSGIMNQYSDGEKNENTRLWLYLHYFCNKAVANQAMQE